MTIIETKRKSDSIIWSILEILSIKTVHPAPSMPPTRSPQGGHGPQTQLVVEGKIRALLSKDHSSLASPALELGSMGWCGVVA